MTGRVWTQLRLWKSPPERKRRRIALIGAGETGLSVASFLARNLDQNLQAVFFLDDDANKIGRTLHGIPILGPIDQLQPLTADAGVQDLVLTMPFAPARRISEVVRLARTAGLRCHVVPAVTQIASGLVTTNRIRSVEFEDLLGRTPARLDTLKIGALLGDKVVLVTGAGGSIGSELCRQIAACHPRQLLVLDQSEVQLFAIEHELLARGVGPRIVPLVADILDEARMRGILSAYRPTIIFHAAAHKHVPLMERQPAEALKNNFLGTSLLARLASKFAVDRFILISTDKAINPTNAMGASKRLAEQVVLSSQHRAGNTTRFAAVRFGNVLGSSGSVIPIFKRQIAEGGPVTVTHPEVTRYFMTIPEASGLVLESATMTAGGEIYVLDMGTPLRIVDVAKQLIRLSGYQPDEDIPITFVGLRPGEKLHEEWRFQLEDLSATTHERVMCLKSPAPTPADIDRCEEEFKSGVHLLNSDQLKELIKRWVPEYQPEPAVMRHPEDPVIDSARGKNPAPIPSAEVRAAAADCQQRPNHPSAP